MDSGDRELPTSQEMVASARRQMLDRAAGSASAEMVAAAHAQVSATEARQDVSRDEPSTGYSARSGVEATANESALTPLSQVGIGGTLSNQGARAGPRRPPAVQRSPFDVPPMRKGRAGILVGLVLAGVVVAFIIAASPDWFDDPDGGQSAPTTVVAEASGGVANDSGVMSVSRDTTLETDHSGQIIIGSSDVTLDCAGHTVTGSGQRVGIAVFDVDDVTVTNCAIEGFEAAIVVINSRRSEIEKNMMSNNSVGVVVMESSQIRLVGNFVNARDRGVRIINSHDCEIAANESTQSAIGFELIDSNGNTLNMNRAAYSDFAGFSLTNANSNVFEANEVASGQFGFVVTASNDNTLEGNSVSHGTGWFSFGFQEGSEGNTVTGNDVTGGGNAFKVYIRAARNTFSENSVDRAAKGFSIDTGCTGNVVELNTITEVREMGLEDTSRGDSGDRGTDNFYRDNQCRGNMTPSQPWGLCAS